ncbi:class I SAM-dependent methyltransferase [Dactylosporangium sp. McL0621]|uniref:class I SAM-dependent methyltransferase n=1 Tax=Dactylosporangium sp. McL0621 TaxID=3415678 RepID=UPI003CF9E301
MESSAPRTAVVWRVLRDELARAARPLNALDVGGGTGGFAVPLAQAGHTVTVVDPSPDALAALTRRAAEAGVGERVRAVQGDGDGLADLVEPRSVDLVLCHSLLEVVDDPNKVVAALAGTLRPGGAASVVVANRAAAVLARAINGHLAAASLLVASPDGRGDPRDRLRRRYDAATATALLDECGLTVEQVHGVRVVADLVPGTVAESEPEALAAFELALAGTPPYRDIATQLHLLARRA